jgi:dihydroxy-acid dehydratase
MPGSVMALVRLDVPGIFVYGGTIYPGRYEGQDVDIVSIFEAVGAYNSGRITQEQFRGIERHAAPGPAVGMCTANTMASAIEALGLSLPAARTR